MIKRILILCTLLLISAYLVLAVTAFNGMELVVKDSVNFGFVTPAEVKALLKAKKLSPEGKPLNSINVRRLEETLYKHPFISDAECYLTSGGKVGIEIYQRIPLMRIMSDNGDNYYIDQEGNIMSAPGKPVHVAVATGYIDRKFAQEELHKLGNYLQADPFRLIPSGVHRLNRFMSLPNWNWNLFPVWETIYCF